MAYQLPSLPYAYDALAPHMSQQTLEFHHGKHHQAYVTNMNKLIEGTNLETCSLEEIVQKSAQDSSQAGLFNNSAQVWNHNFFWNSLSPSSSPLKDGPLKQEILKKFGSIQDFARQFKEAGTTQFGSGWAWLILNKQGTLDIRKTGNADLPLVHGEHALLTCDVWEHAYYLDYQNRRPDYMDIFLNHLINWEFAEDNFKKA